MQNVFVSNKENGVVLITLNRPEMANALSLQLLSEFSEVLKECETNRSIRAVVITGAGDRVFSAGADLKERSRMNLMQARETATTIGRCVNALASLPQPVIAAVNGAAFGGGLELALACDIRVASDTARFALTETSLGIIPGSGGTQRLPRLIGHGRAKDLIFTARQVSAQSALEIGLVEYVTRAEDVLDEALAIAGRIASNAPIAMRQAKFAIDKGANVDLHTGLAIEQSAYEKTIPTLDRLEGLQAFREKRAPIFQGE